MKYFLTLPVLALIAACGETGGRKGVATYTCPNGPELAVAYSDEGARLYLTGGRVYDLPETDQEDVYARPGVVWDAAAFRTARLTEGENSYQCDQMEG